MNRRITQLGLERYVTPEMHPFSPVGLKNFSSTFKMQTRACNFHHRENFVSSTCDEILLKLDQSKITN